MKALTYMFCVFGINFFLTDTTEKKKRLKETILLAAWKMYWDIAVCYYFVGTLKYGVSNSSLGPFLLVHVFDIFTMAVLRFVFQAQVKKMELHFGIMGWSSFVKGEPRVLACLGILFCAVFCFNALSIVRTFQYEKMTRVMEEIFSMNQDVHSLPLCVSGIVWLIIVCCTTFYNVFPTLVSATCYLTLIATHKRLRRFNDNLSKITCFQELASKAEILTDTLSKITVTVSRTNSELSVVIFLLIAFWSSSLFYITSKLILKPNFQDDNVSMTISVLEIVNFSCQFTVLVHLASKIEEEALETKNIVCTVPHIRGKKSDWLVLYSVADNASRQVTVTAWGIFKVARNLVLTMFGMIVTYEMLILKFLEE